MKKIEIPVVRKHGFKERQADQQRLHMQQESDVCEPSCRSGRLKTLVTFQSGSQVYLWTTDRGRSRLIKH